MKICKVVGKIISTIKNESLVGTSLVLVRKVNLSEAGKIQLSDDVYVAADPIGCGEGNMVLVTEGSNSRFAFRNPSTPADMVVIGIVDTPLKEH